MLNHTLLLSEHRYNFLKNNPNRFLVVYPDGQVCADLLTQDALSINVLSGSFNPLHEGHKAMYYHAQHHLHLNNLFFEISLSRVGKAEYNLEEINQIISQFAWYAPVIVTNAPKFVDKIKVLKMCQHGVNFLVGLDTALRITEQYFPADILAMDTIFYVYPRGHEGKVKSIEDIRYTKINATINHLFVDSQFPIDHPTVYMSSTEIRNKRKALEYGGTK